MGGGEAVSEVKRWRIPKILYTCVAPVSETDEVVPAAAYDALKLARDTAEDRIVDLGNRLLKAEAERDDARHEAQQHWDAYVLTREERDAAVAQTTNRDCQIIALKATVERAGNLTRYRADIGVRITDVVEADDLRRALAEPVETRTTGTPGDGSYWHICTICKDVMKDHAHGYGKCVERRGTTGHDVRGRRHMESGFEVKIRYSRFDRRKAQRRKV
jgi:hypothetical protein